MRTVHTILVKSIKTRDYLSLFSSCIINQPVPTIPTPIRLPLKKKRASHHHPQGGKSLELWWWMGVDVDGEEGGR
jgi:hypothetical protein